MTRPSPLPKPKPGPTYQVVMTLLGMAFLAQLGFAAYAVARRLEGKTGPAPTYVADPGRENGEGASAQPGASSAADEGPDYPEELTSGVPELPRGASGSARPPASDPSRPATAGTANSTGSQIETLQPPPEGTERKVLTPQEQQIEEYISLAKAMRANDDVQGALEKLRLAEQMDERNAQVLFEIASTYRKTGREDKAIPYWERIFKLGPSTGIYYELAEFYLDGGGVGADLESDRKQHLRIQEVKEIRDEEEIRGEKINLRIALEARPDMEIVDPEKNVDVRVYFYDMLNGIEIIPHPVRDQEGIWKTQPVDWGDSNARVEIVEMPYFRPLQDAVALAEFGESRYYGFIVELYYQDKLEDIVAKPVRLMNRKTSVASDLIPMDPELQFDPPVNELLPLPDGNFDR